MDYTELNQNGFAVRDGYIQIYRFNESREYFGTDVTWITQGTGIPGSSTAIPVPDFIAGYARCFIDGAWTQVEDHRNQAIYDKTTLSQSIVYSLGPIPDDFTLIPPPSAFARWSDAIAGWVNDDAAQAMAIYNSKRSEIKNNGIAIINGIKNTFFIYDDLAWSLMVSDANKYSADNSYVPAVLNEMVSSSAGSWTLPDIVTKIVANDAAIKSGIAVTMANIKLVIDRLSQLKQKFDSGLTSMADLQAFDCAVNPVSVSIIDIF
ncbi:hypothetical protein [Dickeya chrysanthemi]|uniref:hypothetical protein n=1 Tax=Dickeya chrysanthemi TaxID=556 RepID=UPI0004840A44|nr:hypothetical protein [Dickeya chrysanthemi]